MSGRGDLRVFGFSEYADQGRALAAALGVEFGLVEVRRFPDEESLVRLTEPPPRRIVLMRSLNRPNDKLVELLLTSEAADRLGCRDITLVAPYLCYMRQDTAFHSGEAISQRAMRSLIGAVCHTLVTVDPHLHRVTQLSEALSMERAITVSAAPVVGHFLAAQRLREPFLLGPDEESKQWVAAAAQSGGLEWATAAKTRLGDDYVRVDLPDVNLRGRDVVLLDDIASTGATLAEAAGAVRRAGAANVHVMVIHPLFVSGSLRRLRRARVGRVWSTDSVPHRSNAVSLAPLLAAAVRDALRTAG